MADKGLHDTAQAADSDRGTDNDDDYGVSLDKVEAVLNSNVDKSQLTPQMRRMVQRQEEKGTKANPSWFVPLFCILMIVGLIWAVTYYLTTDYPIPGIGAWNLAIAFGIIMVGFIMTMWWR